MKKKKKIEICKPLVYGKKGLSYSGNPFKSDYSCRDKKKMIKVALFLD